jgi:ABC-type branched-subunit amino acid transport system ATPase component/predicted MFS family arabinose efflux permease
VSTTADGPGEGTGAASLTAGILAQEDELQRREPPAPLDREHHLGAREGQMTLREGLAKGGRRTFVILLLLNSLDELESAALTVLGPDIADALGISTGAMVFITVVSTAFFVVGSVPLGYLADRTRRAPIVGVCSLIFSAMVFLSGLAANAFMLFWTRFGAGISKANTIPVHNSLLADTYPVTVRGRIGATIAMSGRATAAISPLLVGAIAVAAGGVEGEGWRWAFYLLGIPVAIVGIVAFTLREPIRGQWEKRDVLAEVIEDADVPISMEAGFARIWQIRTMRSVIVAFSALGFILFPREALSNFFLEDEFGLDALGRGLVAFSIGVCMVAVLPFAGRHFDRLYREDPAKALALVGWLILPGAVMVPIQFNMPNAVLFTIAGIPTTVAAAAAFAMVGPLLQQVVPYRLRGVGTALGTLYIFLTGALGGALLSALLVGSFGERTAVIVLSVPATLIGGTVLIRSSRYIRADIAMVVDDVRREHTETQAMAADPENIPALTVSGIDFSYGAVQVLFGVDFHVARGETLALLGTNGAGKSTVLRVIAGLGTPSQGTVRLGGRNITFSTPEQRARMGIQMLPGGKGVFPSMSVAENLEMGAYLLRGDRRTQRARIESVLELFPVLAERRNQAAGSMSGGQQQQLALARVMLHEPELLIIDELSLGLAPVVVAELLEVIERIKAERGQTMIIVEQSLNVALAFADRAVFMEKGQVRFEGPAAELAERDDLARAVFFGDEGG